MQKNIGQFLFGKPAQDQLPDRVRDAIAHQQQDSEKLIGWVQLLLVTIFATLYAVSPKTFMNTGIHPVPWRQPVKLVPDPVGYCRYWFADGPDLELPYPVYATGKLLSQIADHDLCVHLHLAAHPAV